MAWNITIKAINRIPVDTVGAGGATGAPALFAGVEVVVDRQGAESGGYVLRLAFADYAGLEAEWNAGTATTVLTAAVATALAAAGVTTNSTLTAAQKALIGTSVAVAE